MKTSSEYLNTLPATPFRSDLNGLRAISILAVLLYHAFPKRFSGGYLGVDIFFLISGYLITQIILSALNKGQFDLRLFYIKRANRLFPSLLVVFLFSLVAGAFCLVPNDYAALGKHIAAGTTFTSNFLLWSEIGYFDNLAISKPFLHLWSLGIEEQFYLLWPILLVVFSMNIFIRKRLIILCGLTIVSGLLFITYSQKDFSTAFYLPFFRFWELSLGGLLAYYERSSLSSQFALKPLFNNYPWIKKVLAYGILSLLCAFTLGYIISPQKQSIIILCTAFLSLILIAIGQDNVQFCMMLQNPICDFIGKISYPLYLWHWVLLAFLNHFQWKFTYQQFAFCKGIVVAASILIAYLTYRFIETPVRAQQTRRFPKWLLSGMGALCFLSLIILQLGGLPERYPKTIQDIITPIDFKFAENARFGTCHYDNGVKNNYARVGLPECTELNKPLVLIWGDSTAAALYPGLKELQKKSNLSFGIAQTTMCGTPPFLIENADNACVKKEEKNVWNHKVIKFISDKKPELIILHASWNSYARKEKLLRILQNTIHAIHQASVNSQIVVLGPVPKWGNWDDGLPKVLYRYWLSHQVDQLPIYLQFGLSPEPFELDNYFNRAFKKLGVNYLSAIKVFCPNGTDCRTRIGSHNTDLVQIDNEHLSMNGSKYLIQGLEEKIFAALEDQ